MAVRRRALMTGGVDLPRRTATAGSRGTIAPMRKADTVGQAGEDSVLAAIRSVIDPFNAERHGVEMGPGDDAAVLTLTGAATVMTVDTMSEGQDFRREWWLGPEALEAAQYEPEDEWPMDIGTKAAAQNLSDLNAMGVRSAALLVSLTLPSQTPLAWVKDFYRGVIRACEQPGAEDCVIAGGDLGSGETISVTITAVGEAAGPGRLLTRGGALPGDVLAVCGPLGQAAAGLALLERLGAETVEHAELRWWQDFPNTFQRCLRAQQCPSPPLMAGPGALAAGATAGMDISDGLLRDAGRLARASGVRIRLDDTVLQAEARELEPVAEAIGLGSEATVEWVLAGGEDYGLLATFPDGVTLPEGFRRVGRVEALETSEQSRPDVVTGLRAVGQGWDSVSQS